MKPDAMVIPVEIQVRPRRYALRIIAIRDSLSPYIRFLDEANELGYNIVSVNLASDGYSMLVTYEATHETETT